jgi:hypothetical protein
MNLTEIMQFIAAALECSVYLAPTEPGLTQSEIFEVCRRAGYQDGEIGDAVPRVVTLYIKGPERLLPSAEMKSYWQFFFHETPEFRNIDAFDFLATEMTNRAKAEGMTKAACERSLLVERAVAKDIPRRDIEAAITISLMCNRLIETNGVLRMPAGCNTYPLPSAQLKSQQAQKPIDRPQRKRAYPIVKDTIERRTDKRPKYVESLDEFGEALAKMGFSGFRLWWQQTVAELRLGDTQSTPVCVSVLAAALVEGALTFAAKHARSKNLGFFASSDFDKDPRTWKIDDLIKSAASGGSVAIFDQPTRQRVETLIKVRTRIHAGRMLSEFPTGAPDLRPEEARDSRATAENVVRRVLDWVEQQATNPKPTRPRDWSGSSATRE